MAGRKRKSNQSEKKVIQKLRLNTNNIAALRKRFVNKKKQKILELQRKRAR